MEDILLRVASVAIFLLILYQLFWSKGGSALHVFTGIATLCCGFLIIVLVSIRGAKQETMSVIYAIHLALGSLFFFFLFLTAIFGFASRTKVFYVHSHQKAGKLTLWFLLGTLVLGIFSRYGSLSPLIFA